MRSLFLRASRSAVAWSLVATALRFGAALFILPLVLRLIAPEELGLWYVFLSLGSLAALLDFGFGPTVIRCAGYLWAGAVRLLPFGVEAVPPVVNPEPGDATAPPPNVATLANLVTSLRIYYAVVGLGVVGVLVLGGGAWVWHKSAALPTARSLRLAFIVYAFGVSLNFANSLWVYLLAGIGGVRQSQQITAACLCLYYVVAIGGLLSGFGVWALVAGSVVMGFSERLLGRAAFLRLVKLPRGRFQSSMLRVLWPNAWRTGAVSLGAFMIVQANTLICSAFLDLKTTASYGMSMQAVSLLVGVSSVWVTVKIPTVNQLRAHQHLAAIANLFRQRIALSIFTFAAGACTLLWLGAPLLKLVNTRTQLLPFALLATLLAIQFLEMHHSLYANLVYSENQNPFLRSALISGAAIVLLSIVFTPRLGIRGMLLSAGFVQLCYNNWWPVLRAIRGLGPAAEHYWRGFLHQRQ